MLTKEFKVSLKKKEKHTHFLKLHGSHLLHFLERKSSCCPVVITPEPEVLPHVWGQSETVAENSSPDDII